jgi:hypothetical protein
MLNLNKSPLWRFILITALLLGLSVAFVRVQGAAARSSVEAIHAVNPLFQKFHDEHGGLRIFGYPLTDLFEYGGLQVQYFQKARMEFHPENPPAYRVQLGLLGDQLGRGTPPLPPTNIDLYHRYFPETGHTVAFAFLNFFDNHGNLDVFGYPIAEFTFENGYYVQYFQRVKMVWHPEMSGDDRMQLADLGSIHFDVARLPADLKNSTAPGLLSNDPSIKINPSVSSPVSGSSGQQKLFVYVVDAQGIGVEGVSVSYSVHAPKGQAPFTSIGQTDANGFVATTFAIDGSNLGELVIIEVRAVNGAANASTEIAYRPWH